MHKLIAGVTILEHELSELRLLVERQTGVLLDCPNSALAAHISDYLDTHELESPVALLEQLRGGDLDPVQMAAFLDGVLNVKTGFFRHPGRNDCSGAARNAATLYTQSRRRRVRASHLERRLWHRRRSLLYRHGDLRSHAEWVGKWRERWFCERQRKQGIKRDPQRGHIGAGDVLKRTQGVVDPHRRQRFVAIVDSGRGARIVSAIGAARIASVDDSSLLLEDWIERSIQRCRGRLSAQPMATPATETGHICWSSRDFVAWSLLTP